jgi:hypothetical protein
MIFLSINVIASSSHYFSVTEYETSCFSGKYVTGANINDEYFAKLHELRNDDAKKEREDREPSQAGMPPGSHDGCENLSNDKRVQDL